MVEIGAPLHLCKTILMFYIELKRIFSLQGTLGSSWVNALHGLMQGCPLSMMLIAGPMAIWYQHVQLTGAEVAIFVDDRNVWTTGVDAEVTLKFAFDAGDEIDLKLGLDRMLASFNLLETILTYVTGSMQCSRNLERLPSTSKLSGFSTILNVCLTRKFRTMPTESSECVFIGYGMYAEAN